MPAIEVDWNIVTENSGIEDDEEWEITVEDGGTVSEEVRNSIIWVSERVYFVLFIADLGRDGRFAP